MKLFERRIRWSASRRVNRRMQFAITPLSSRVPARHRRNAPSRVGDASVRRRGLLDCLVARKADVETHISQLKRAIGGEMVSHTCILSSTYCRPILKRFTKTVVFRWVFREIEYIPVA